MVVTVEELQRLEDTDIRELKREDLDNAGDVTFDKTKVCQSSYAGVFGKNQKSICGECGGVHSGGYLFQDF